MTLELCNGLAVGAYRLG